MSASVTLTPTFVPGEVTTIIAGGIYLGSGAFGIGRAFDLSLDGTRFLMLKSAVTTEDAPLWSPSTGTKS